MKEKILESAKGLFQQHGIKLVTLDDIAHHLSISKKTIYEHFRNKEEIADAVAEEIIEESIQKIEAIRQSVLNPVLKVIEVGKWLYEVLNKTNPLFLVEVRRYFFKSYVKFQSRINSGLLISFAGIIEEGKKKGFFRSDLNSILMSKYCIELIRMGIRNEDFNKDENTIRIMFDYYILGILTLNGKKRYERAIRRQITGKPI